MRVSQLVSTNSLVLLKNQTGIIRCWRRFTVLIGKMAQNLFHIMRLCYSNPSLTQIFHIKTLAQESLDLVDHVKTCSKDQYVIEIQAQYNSLTPTMAVVTPRYQIRVITCQSWCNLGLNQIQVNSVQVSIKFKPQYKIYFLFEYG
jgi:hypothetical protein